LRRGIERGELPRDLDLDLVLDILYGAIYMRFLIRHDELSAAYVKQVCRLVLSGAAGSPREPQQCFAQAAVGPSDRNKP
jgi:hypothetical protein